jgi:hypothetical protein
MEIHCTYTKLIPVGEIKKHPKNTNTHSKKQIEEIKKSLTQCGIRKPFIASSFSGLLVSGHGRLEACKKLGIEMLPVDFQEFEDEQAEINFLIRDNYTALFMDLDLTLSLEMIGELPEVDFSGFGEEQSLERDDESLSKISIECKLGEKDKIKKQLKELGLKVI